MNQNTDILHEAKRLRLLAAALELQHYTSAASNIVPIPGTERMIAIGTPAQVRALLAKEYRAAGDQPPLGGGDAIERSKRILLLVDQYVDQQNAENRTALRTALMHEFDRNVTPARLLEIARATGLRYFLHGVGATDARQLLADFVAAVPAAACGTQQAAAHVERCPHCDDTGDVHSPMGEWRGTCTCPAGAALQPGVTESEGGHHD